MSTAKRSLDSIIYEITSRNILPNYWLSIKDTNEYELCIAILVGLDIFRALRKFVFPKAKTVKQELAHLLNPVEFPRHYPNFLKEYNFRPEVQSKLHMSSTRNMAYMTVEQILAFNNNTKNLTGRRQKETWLYADSRLLVSNTAFNQLLKVTSVESLSLIFSTFLGVNVRVTSPGCLKEHTEMVMHQGTPLERSCFMCPTSTVIRDLPNWCVNSVLFVGFVHKQEKGAKKALLLDGELSGTIVPSEYICSFTDKPTKVSPLNTLLMSGVYKRIVNHYSGNNTGHNAMYKIQGDLVYHYYLKKNTKQHYVLKNKLDPEYIVSNSIGHFRLDREASCPLQFVDIVDEGFTAENYVRKLAAPLETQSFLENFDGNALVKILESIPGFVYSFSEQQRKLIASHHNCVVVGRSGTGKTTCAVMRMIGIRLLEIADRNAKKGIKKIRYEDLCQSNLSDDHRNIHENDLHYCKSIIGQKCEQIIPQSTELPQVIAQRKREEENSGPTIRE